MTEGNKKQYIADVRVMNYLLQAIPNDINNSVNACKNAKEIWEQIKRYGFEITTHVRHSRLMDEFDMFAAKEGESLDSVHERLTTLVNIMDRYGGNANKNVGRNITQGFNTRNAGNESNQIIQRVPRTESTSGKANVQCYNCNEKGHYARKCQKPKVHDLKYSKEQMLSAIKDEARSNLSNEENNIMLDTSYGEELEELTTSVMLMDRIQPANKNAETVPSYDATVVSQVHALCKVHEQVNHGKRKTIIQTIYDDQIYYNIIFDDLFVENNGGTSEHDSTAHDEYREIQMLAYNVQREAENQNQLSNELKQQKDLLQRELETFKDRVKTSKESKSSSTLHDENVLVKHQVESTVNERENIKLEYERLFNSAKATRAQHKKEINEMFEYVTQKTYAYAEVRAQNQDLLMTISKLKSKLKMIDNGKHVNTKFEKSETLGQLLCVTPFNKNLAIKTKNVSNTKATSDRSNPVTSQSTSTIKKKQQQNANIIERGMYKINQEDTKTPDSKTNKIFQFDRCRQFK
nr:hypothetical protein [Tanacetum cinerariifolium]